ncbi:MAG: translation initiation factor eIF-1A [Candidatus Poseidoniales archaeon]
MGRRHEEKVDAEELARLEDDGGQGDSNIRVKMPDRRINEMFALAKQLLGGRRVTVLCEDGEERMARIPGKMRRRQYVRENDLIIIWPWDFQPTKADVKHRYTKTQAMYLSRKGLLNEVVDDFGMDVRVDEEGDDDLFASSVMLDDEFEDEEESSEETSDDDDMFASEDDDEDMFASDDDDDGMFASDDDDDDIFATEDDGDVVETASPEPVEAEPFVVKEEYPEDEEITEDDDDDDEVDALFG